MFKPDKVTFEQLCRVEWWNRGVAFKTVVITCLLLTNYSPITRLLHSHASRFMHFRGKFYITRLMSHLRLELLNLEASCLSLVSYSPWVAGFYNSCLVSSSRPNPDSPIFDKYFSLYPWLHFLWFSKYSCVHSWILAFCHKSKCFGPIGKLYITYYGPIATISLMVCLHVAERRIKLSCFFKNFIP